jgi:hypothetical protein
VRVFSTQYDICHCVENDPEREEQEELTCCWEYTNDQLHQKSEVIVNLEKVHNFKSR